MALIKCPECRREISDTAESCPHCGYKIEKKELEEFVPVKTNIYRGKPSQKQIIKGILCIVFGAAFAIWGLFMGLTGLLPQLFVAAGVIAIVTGCMFFRGPLKGTCPYCGADLTILKQASACRCADCKNTMTMTKNQLISTHPIEKNEK